MLVDFTRYIILVAIQAYFDENNQNHYTKLIEILILKLLFQLHFQNTGVTHGIYLLNSLKVLIV